MIKKKEKNIFINCDKGFFKTKPDRNAITFESSKVLKGIHGKLAGFH